MPIQVVEIHHPAVRIKGDEADLKANLDFYEGLLGLKPDEKRPNIRDVPGFWINVGEVGQVHLIGGKQPSWMAKRDDQDPTSPHIALAVKDVAEAKAELERRGVISFFEERAVWQGLRPNNLVNAAVPMGTSLNCIRSISVGAARPTVSDTALK